LALKTGTLLIPALGMAMRAEVTLARIRPAARIIALRV
jgi:hypothetical protein